MNAAATYQSLADKPYESDYLLVETTLSHAIERVWPHIIQIGTWMTDHRMTTIEGEPGQEGHFERVFPQDLDASVPAPLYHLYGIAKIIPHKLIAMEVFPERGGSYGKSREWVMFDSIILTDLGDRTHIAFLLIDMHAGHGEPKSSEKLAEEEAQRDTMRDRLQRFFLNLDRLVSQNNC